METILPSINTSIIGESGNPRTYTSNSDEDCDALEAEGKIKTRLMSMWNNVKYGWMVKTKTNFSKDSAVWLLGRCYHKRLEGDIDTGEAGGIEEFKLDFVSRIWLTYRREFPHLNGSSFTSDCGWGCMLRSGQMLLAQALICHFLGRDWRWRAEVNASSQHRAFVEDMLHRRIIKWFGDSASRNCPLSIHALVGLGQGCGKRPGEWYGPASVAHLLRQAVETASTDYDHFDGIRVYVAQDCAIYIQDVVDLCEARQCETSFAVSDDPSANESASGTFAPSWKAVVILVPVRLGTEKLNSIYGPCLTGVLTLDHCIGIIGGRPKHSLYFIGFQDDKLIHLDPHYCQDVVDVWEAAFPLHTFHCRSPRKMPLSRMDPSCCIGFYCKTREDFNRFVKNVKPGIPPGPRLDSSRRGRVPPVGS
ncbi:cysteine protease ATG4D isoform X2 [Ischnura elegans]|uniref:cysteine protease ATG4D isoform X2 n=1 Tax=Ischnura elegans TaxID=197161 RepID=UPI001ED8ADA2|nr:cysteine protease ATG4D isoform X2 [Ischnura elegans]